MVRGGGGGGGGAAGDECCALDRLDNVAKAAAISGDYFVLYAEHDEMMMPDFSPRLHAARYAPPGADSGGTRILRVPGGHCSFFGDVPALAAAYKAYLVQVQFVQG